MWKLWIAVGAALLLGSASAVYGGDMPEKSYASAKYHFRFQYPASYSLTELPDGVEVFTQRGYGSGMSLVIHDLRALWGVCSLSRKNDCKSPQDLARFRAKRQCDGDGPDGESYCLDGDVTMTQVQIGSKKAMEFHMVVTSEDYDTHTKKKSKLNAVCYFIVLSPDADGQMMEICGDEGGVTPDIVRSLRFE